MNLGHTGLIAFLKKHRLIEETADPARFVTTSKPLLRALVESGLVCELTVFRAITEHLQFEIFTEDDLDRVDVLKTFELMKRVSYKKCVEAHCLPVVMNTGAANLLLTNPFDVETVKEFRFVLGQEFGVLLVSGQNLNSLLCRCDLHEAQELDELENLEFGAQLEILNSPDDQASFESASDIKAPIITIVNKIIVDAITSKASDIHLEPNQWSFEVRNRIDGNLHRVLEIPKRLQKAVTARIKLLSNMDISEHRKPQDGRMQLRINGQVTDLRVSCIPTSQGECLVLRILQTDKSKLRLDNLKLPKDVEQRLRRAISAEGKMLLVTGPTGSGKTTTLYSCLTELQKDSPNIVTVEDPIEYRLAGVNQMQVNESAGLTFASALRSVMRQDPDIILIGEIRDRETADIAIQAAQTGHLVLSTLHTNDAPSAITRLIDLGVEPFMVASSVSGVVAQRLVRRICPNCISPISKEKIQQYSKDESLFKFKFPLEKLQAGSGCARCRGSGYLGRVGIYSFLEISRDIAEVMQCDLNLNKILQVAESEGFVDLDVQAIRMASEGITTIDEIKPYLASGTQSVEERVKSKSKYIGILSESANVKDKLLETINKEKSLIPVALDSGQPKVDLAIYIIDESLSADSQNLFLSLLNEKNLTPPIIILGKSSGSPLEKYTGVIETIGKGSSPLAIVNRCRQLVKAS